jgi:ribosomal protein S18 acetylase RimI-like enzyme
LEIRVADINLDLNQIVDLHIQAFPNFFLTAMGTSFVTEYYRAVLEFSENISLVAIQGEKTLGFVVGFGNPIAFYQFYKARRLRLIPIILLALIKKPRLLKRILLNFYRISSVTSLKSDVELSSIGVDSSMTQTGIGKSLIKTFVKLARERGYRSVYLTTDAEENAGVNLFYIKQGFTLEHTFVLGNRKMNEYRILL